MAHLVDLTNARTLDAEATYNSQINFGEDYIRRIIYAEENNAFDEMQNRIVHDVNNLIVTLAARQKACPEQSRDRFAGYNHGYMRRQHGDDSFFAQS